MKDFGDALKDDARQGILEDLSLALARACRNSLARSWHVSDWKNPTRTPDHSRAAV
jgi:hypothetical protein